MEFVVFSGFRDWDLEIIRNREQRIKNKNIIGITNVNMKRLL
jgi:hypothetical protein